MPEALFLPDGGRFVPTALCRGPWTPDAQHGGPPAALLARSIEHAAGEDGMQTARLTVELLRPVPLAPLTVEARITRPGRKVRLLEASLRADDEEVARAVALRIRRREVPMPAGVDGRPTQPPSPGEGAVSAWPWTLTDLPAFHSHAVEHRFVAGGFDRPGPATDWIRLRVPLVAGEPTPPLARVAAVADFGNGISWVLSQPRPDPLPAPPPRGRVGLPGGRDVGRAARYRAGGEPPLGRAGNARTRAAESPAGPLLSRRAHSHRGPPTVPSGS
jgi:Thioesterase-like superfamily